ncbi:MAG TPA: alpha-amylase family glycosyl hydrolase [Aggregatilineales bacterium]|nr:alpha-amylase family glycosyl hydrolase [Aggregatilineales bacterium]
MKKNPLIYEINTWVWLADLRAVHGQDLNLGNLPSQVLDDLAAWNIDIVWLMGVWERSPRSRELGQQHPDLQGEFKRALPTYTPERVAGSPYAVHRYEVDTRLGGRDGLAAFRATLKQRGIDLILDFVPNHTAVDHPLTIEAPECFIRGTRADLTAAPGSYFAVPEANAGAGAVIAYGRDPNFPAWTDTAQLNAFSPQMRAWTVRTLQEIASQCDGVRCDMAMLMVNRIFARTWEQAPESIPGTEFWSAVIPPVKAQAPDFLFIAEVYWDMEAELHGLGFDFCYDKRLYDRLRRQEPASVRDHLLAEMAYQERLVRFIENHDEPRAVSAFGIEKAKASAVLSATLPGATLFHEGQFEGRQTRVPVQLDARPGEPPIDELTRFYRLLTAELRHPAYHDGTYMALAVNPIVGQDGGIHQIVAFAWALGSDINDWRIVIINLSDQVVRGRVMIPNPALGRSSRWQVRDALNPELAVSYSGEQLLVGGLPVELGPFQSHIFQMANRR